MSALEKFSVAPFPSRHALRALPAFERDWGDVATPLEAVIRLAERLLPDSVLVLDRPGQERLLTWPPGMMGRRTSMDSLARALLHHSGSDGEVWVENLEAVSPFSGLREVQAAGPLGFGCVPLPGRERGGRFAVVRGVAAWTAADRELIRDTAAVLAGECERLLLTSAAAPAEPLASEHQRRSEVWRKEEEQHTGGSLTSIAPLLSGVCHELNNPLTAIKSFAELLLLDARSEEDREALEIVQREAHRAARIIADLRMVARQSAEASLHRDFVDVNGVVQQVVETRLDELRLQRIEVRQEPTPDLPAVRAVRSHLEQAVSHLVSNAIQAMAGREGPRVLCISTCRSDTGVVLRVRDSGRGIAPEHLGRIFDLFWTNRRPGEGSGLGLSLVQSIVASHGGRVEARSQLDRGAVIQIELPIASQCPPELVTTNDPPARRGLRVLVVDDEAPHRYSLARYMERRGHEVHQAQDGCVAVEMLKRAGEGVSYDIIIADLRVAGVSGKHLLAHLGEQSSALEQRLILTTGEPLDPADAARVQEHGIPVISKPFELPEVAQVIEAHAMLVAG